MSDAHDRINKQWSFEPISQGCFPWSSVPGRQKTFISLYRDQEVRRASWHCCYAPCPCADKLGSAATILSVCQASGDHLCTRIIWQPTGSADASRHASIATETPALSLKQLAPGPASAQQSFIGGTPDRPELPGGQPHRLPTGQAQQQPSAGQSARLSSGDSIAQQVLQEVHSIRSAAARAAGQGELAPCRLVVMRLGFMDECELSGWSDWFAGLAKNSIDEASPAHHKNFEDLLVACCRADSLSR